MLSCLCNKLDLDEKWSEFATLVYHYPKSDSQSSHGNSIPLLSHVSYQSAIRLQSCRFYLGSKHPAREVNRPEKSLCIPSVDCPSSLLSHYHEHYLQCLLHHRNISISHGQIQQLSLLFQIKIYVSLNACQLWVSWYEAKTSHGSEVKTILDLQNFWILLVEPVYVHYAILEVRKSTRKDMGMKISETIWSHPMSLDPGAALQFYLDSLFSA